MFIFAIRFIVAVLILASAPLAFARSDAPIDIFVPPVDRLSIYSHQGPPKLYGSDLGIARWHIAQWDNPAGDLPDLKNGRTANGGMSVEIKKAPFLTYNVTQNGDLLSCSEPRRIIEFDGFIGANTRRNNPDQPSAEGAGAIFPKISDFSSLTQKIELNVRDAAFNNKPPRCELSKAISLISLVLTNPSQRSTFFYQVILYSFGTSPRPAWWARGEKNGRFGFNDLIVNYGLPMGGLKARVHYEFDMLARLKALIQKNAVGMDPNLDHWHISGAYFGNAIWGDLRISTEWSKYSLQGTIH